MAMHCRDVARATYRLITMLTTNVQIYWFGPSTSSPDTLQLFDSVSTVEQRRIFHWDRSHKVDRVYRQEEPGESSQQLRKLWELWVACRARICWASEVNQGDQVEWWNYEGAYTASTVLVFLWGWFCNRIETLHILAWIAFKSRSSQLLHLTLAV